MWPDTPPRTRATTPSPKPNDALSRVATLQQKVEYAHTLQSVPSISNLSLGASAPSKPLLSRFSSSRPKREDSLDKNEEVLCGFLKKSTGPWSIAWWQDAMPKNRHVGNEPGRGWRPFKVVFARGVLHFYKVPSVMIPEIRSTFQVRATAWPNELEENEAPSSPLDTDLPSSAIASSDTASVFQENTESVWESEAKHPDLTLVQSGMLPSSWAARIEHATGAALAHELVFATQRVNAKPSNNGMLGDASHISDRAERSFLHIVFFALGTSSVPFDTFLKHLHTFFKLAQRLGVVHTDPGCVRRISLFLELLLWKRPLLPNRHETMFFQEADQLATGLTRIEPGMYMPLVRQFRAWRENYRQTVGFPTDWQRTTEAGAIRKSSLDQLYSCWTTGLFLSSDAMEIAQQIQCFHADRLASFVRAPITAYRLASTVSETLLRSFRFDASRPHWLTHVILRQVLVDEAPERQAGGDRAEVVMHWTQVASASLRLRDFAGWLAIVSALCSRPVACVEWIWRHVQPAIREQLMSWAQELITVGWLEGVHTSLEPKWSQHNALDPDAIPFLGNAGLTQAATPLFRRARSSTEVQIAAQEPEFNRVRALAQRIAGMYEVAKPAVGCITPIQEYQCLFQRLAQHEYPLHTGIVDYLGSAVAASGINDLRNPAESRPWDQGASLPLFPYALPVALPGGMAPGAWPPLFDWLARYEQRGEDVPVGEALRLRSMPEPRSRASIACAEALAAPLGLRRLVSQDLSLDALASLARPAEAPSQYSVEIAAASSVRLVDLLVLGASHLVVRSPIPQSDPPDYRVLNVALDLPAFRDAVLLSHSRILSSAQLLDALRLRWNEAEAASREMAWHARSHVPNQYPSWTTSSPYAREPADWGVVAKIRHGVLTTLQRWFTLNAYEFIVDPMLFESAYTFLCDAAAECDESPADAPKLSNLIDCLKGMYPKLVMSCIAQYAYEPKPIVLRSLNTNSAVEIGGYLSSIVAPLYACVNQTDMARAALSLAQVTPNAWCAAGVAMSRQGSHSVHTFARLLRLLSAPVDQGSERVGLFDALPASIRSICDAHDTIAAWVESYVVDIQFDFPTRVQRMSVMLEIVALLRTQAAKEFGGKIDGPIPPSLIESALLDGLTSPTSLSYVDAWNQVSEGSMSLMDKIQFLGKSITDRPSGNGTANRQQFSEITTPQQALPTSSLDGSLAALDVANDQNTIASPAPTRLTMGTAPNLAAYSTCSSSMKLSNGENARNIQGNAHRRSMSLAAQHPSHSVAAAAPPTPSNTSTIPDMYWALAWLASCAIRLPVDRDDSMFSVTGFMALRDIAQTVYKEPQTVSNLPDSLLLATERLAWMKDAVKRTTWPSSNPRSVNQESDSIALVQGTTTVNSEVPRLFQAYVAAQERKISTLTSFLPPAPPTVVTPAPLDLRPAETTPTKSAEPPVPTRSDALLAAVPSTRVASTFPCAGALIKVWPFEKHPYVFELILPNSTRTTLKVPDYASFCQWLAHLQSVPHVRVDASFDPGEYAAQVAEHQGRACVAALFQVSLRELHIRTGTAVPPAIEALLREVESRGVHEQGIYRISGGKQAVDGLRKALKSQNVQPMILTRVDVHVIASCIKLWLRELPEPVVPFRYFHRLLEAEEITDPMRRVRLVGKLVRSFPPSHYLALERIASHLAVIARASKVNLMAPHNIGLVFGSTLLSPPPGSSSVAEGFHSLGKAAHIVKILVVMHRHIFPTLGANYGS
ncbi:hypothetical protein MYAM1_003215 [Malassezia yamatoensis]|uniref:Rho-GAP domain-containing protein n=1 Tax=Malassezia yamatoensis TaxID=253288 RepID=A0AAJ6CIN8_9BASI|nr:hypothetical protein MYAM1_003215 [Malassezia yamatoensis]